MNPVVLAVLVRECVRLLRLRAPGILKELIEARHPDSDGGRTLTSQERRDIVRVALKRIADEDEQGE
jgi:hypothetical protein